MVPMNFMWCAFFNESTMVFWNIWTKIMGSSQASHWRLAVATFALFEDRRIRSETMELEGPGGPGGPVLKSPEELELKSCNISHTSLMGALAPWLQIRIFEKPQPNYVCLWNCENGVKWVKEQGIIFEILNHTEPFLYFLPFPEANCQLSLWMPAAIWVCPKVMKMGVSQSFFPFFCREKRWSTVINNEISGYPLVI